MLQFNALVLQLPLEKPEPNDNFIEPKSEFVEETEEGVEDLTLDDDMNDLNDMEQDNNRAGPSHDSTQHSGKFLSFFIFGFVSIKAETQGFFLSPK